MHYRGYTWDVGFKLESGHVSDGYGHLMVCPNLVVTGRPPWSCCWCHHLWFVTLPGIPLFSLYGPNRQLEWPYNLDLKMKVGKVPSRVHFGIIATIINTKKLITFCSHIL